MRNSLTVLLVVAVGVLSLFAYKQSTEIKELKEKLGPRPKATSLDLQGKCAKQALEAFRQGGWEKEKLAWFENHYNAKLNKCFVEIQNYGGQPGTVLITKTVSDAFEGKVYASYSWAPEKDKESWEVPPWECRVTLLSGREKSCQSSKEFDGFIKDYMQ